MQRLTNRKSICFVIGMIAFTGIGLSYFSGFLQKEDESYKIIGQFLTSNRPPQKVLIYLRDSTRNSMMDFEVEWFKRRIYEKSNGNNNLFSESAWIGLLDKYKSCKFHQLPNRKLLAPKMKPYSTVQFMNAQQCDTFIRSNPTQGLLYTVSDILWNDSFNKCMFMVEIHEGLGSKNGTIVVMEKKGTQWYLVYRHQLWMS